MPVTIDTNTLPGILLHYVQRTVSQSEVITLHAFTIFTHAILCAGLNFE